MGKFNIKIAGKEFKDVSKVQLKTTEGNNVNFCDTSDTTATANDVAIGKKFLTSDGTYSEGRAETVDMPRFTIIQTPNQKISVDMEENNSLSRVSNTNGKEEWGRRVITNYGINLVPNRGWDCGKLLFNGKEITNQDTIRVNDRGVHTDHTYSVNDLHGAVITATEATETKIPPAMFNFEGNFENYGYVHGLIRLGGIYWDMSFADFMINSTAPSSKMAEKISYIRILKQAAFTFDKEKIPDDPIAYHDVNAHLVLCGSDFAPPFPMASSTFKYPPQECELYIDGVNYGKIKMENKELFHNVWAWCAPLDDFTINSLEGVMRDGVIKATNTISLVGFLCPHQTSIVGEEFSFREVDISDRHFDLKFTSSSKGIAYNGNTLLYNELEHPYLRFPNIDKSVDGIWTSLAGWCSIWIDDMCVIPKIFADTEDIDTDGYHTFIKLSDEELADIRLRLESIASTADEINKEVGATRLPPGTEPIHHTLSFKEPVIGKVPNEIGDTALELQCMIVDVTSEKIIDDKGVIYKAVVGKQKPLVIDNVDILFDPLGSGYSLALEGRTNFQWNTAYPLSSNTKYKLEIDGDYICDVVSNEPTLGGEHDNYYNTTYTQTFNLLNPSDEKPIYHYFADLTKVRTVKLKTITDTTPPDVDVDP